jgi:hypothetical protein
VFRRDYEEREIAGGEADLSDPSRNTDQGVHVHGESKTGNVHGADRSLLNMPQPCACDPIDGELCLGCVKPGEISVEALSRSDVQFDGVTWA